MGLFDKGKKAAEEAKKVTEEANKRIRQAEAKARAAETAAKIQKARAEASKKRLAKMEAEKKVAAIRARHSGVSGSVRAKPGVAGGIFAPGIGKASMPKIIAQYTVVKGDTLSAIAKRYYGSATKPYWELIQKANSDVIKDANMIHPGQVFKIPVLPEELEKK